MINITSSVSLFTGDGFVALRWGDESGQLTPEEAMQHGLHVIEAAVAAKHDAGICKALQAGGMSGEDVARFLTSLRKSMDR